MSSFCANTSQFRRAPGESLRDQLDRLSLLSARQTAAAKLETCLAQEKQFNRKVKINAQLRATFQETADVMRT